MKSLLWLVPLAALLWYGIYVSIGVWVFLWILIAAILIIAIFRKLIKG